MNQKDLLNEIISYCHENANEDIVKKYSRYFKGGYQAFGLTQDLLYAKVDEILRKPEISDEWIRCLVDIRNTYLFSGKLFHRHKDLLKKFTFPVTTE